MPFDFMKLSEKELFEVWKSTNVYQWNDLLGPKPDGFDDLPVFRKKRKSHSKSDYTAPVWRVANTLLGPERVKKFLYEEMSPFDKISFILFECITPGAKLSSLEPILEHFAKTLDL